jgi:hypothetical protein
MGQGFDREPRKGLTGNKRKKNEKTQRTERRERAAPGGGHMAGLIIFSHHEVIRGRLSG